MYYYLEFWIKTIVLIVYRIKTAYFHVINTMCYTFGVQNKKHCVHIENGGGLIITKGYKCAVTRYTIFLFFLNFFGYERT